MASHRYRMMRTVQDGEFLVRTARWPNGLRAICHEHPSKLTTVLQLRIAGGPSYEEPTSVAVPHYVEHLLLTSPKGYSRKRFAQWIDWIGDVAAYTFDDSVGLGAEVEPAKWRSALDGFYWIVTNNYESNGAEKRNIVQEMKTDQLDLEAASKMVFNRVLWEGSVYAEATYGSIKDLKQISDQTVREYLEKVITGRRLIVSAAGRIKARDFFKQVDALFGKLPEGEVPEALKPERARPGIQLIRKRTASQVAFVLGQALPKKDVSYSASTAGHIFDRIVGKMYSSRMYLSVRGQGGCYSIDVGGDVFPEAESVLLQATVEPAILNDVLEEYISTLQRIRWRGVTTSEFDTAMANYRTELKVTSGVPRNRMIEAADDLFSKGAIESTRYQCAKLMKLRRNHIRRYVRDHIGWQRSQLVVLGKIDGFKPSKRVRRFCGQG